MRRVKDVLYEIETLRKEANILENIVGKMVREEEIYTYMKDTFGVNYIELGLIRTRLDTLANKLEESLNDYEVEV